MLTDLQPEIVGVVSIRWWNVIVDGVGFVLNSTGYSDPSSNRIFRVEPDIPICGRTGNSGCFLEIWELRRSPPNPEILCRNWKLWLNRKVGKVLKQQIHGSNPRKTQQIKRSLEIPFGYFFGIFLNFGKNKKIWGGKGDGKGVKSVATLALIPYDEG